MDNRERYDTFAAGEFPLTLALGVDRSASMMGERLRLAKQASRTFLSALGHEDRSMVVAIGSEADVVAPLSTDRALQLQAVDALDAWSTTALRDAVVATLDRLEPEPGRQALVIFSDGVDTVQPSVDSAGTRPGTPEPCAHLSGGDWADAATGDCRARRCERGTFLSDQAGA